MLADAYALVFDCIHSAATSASREIAAYIIGLIVAAIAASFGSVRYINHRRRSQTDRSKRNSRRRR